MARIKNKSQNAGKYLVKRKKSSIEIEKEEVSSNENKLYWSKILIAGITAILGTVGINLVGWLMLLWMLLFMLLFPLLPNYFIMRDLYDTNKKEWIKTTLKTGIGGFFFIFMFLSTMCHTLLVFSNFNFV